MLLALLFLHTCLTKSKHPSQPKADAGGKEVGEGEHDSESDGADRGPPLPTMILSNIRSLQNKIEELRNNASFCYEYWEAGIMVITETGLHSDIVSSLVERTEQQLQEKAEEAASVCM
ncbi:hypothetical protein AAFF_G00090630 [Aldrovandia affinis]|uniref:Uncharacterized protein n=1 Tax=Aldrovandia affinis TaxID=143900 RepID=A0AAD7RVP6_9TELE|nr:hypothetical protein AAFF_G00090630 [Aldrovandia affinis]